MKMAANVPGFTQFGNQDSVRLADAAENEVNDYYFTLHDPTTRQPVEPKLGFALKTKLAIVRPGFTNDLLCEPFILV